MAATGTILERLDRFQYQRGAWQDDVTAVEDLFYTRIKLATQKKRQAEGGSDNTELTDLDADIETDQGAPKLSRRQSEFTEETRESQSVYEPEREYEQWASRSTK